MSDEISDKALIEDYIRARTMLETSNDMSDISAWRTEDEKFKKIVLELKVRGILTNAVNAYFNQT